MRKELIAVVTVAVIGARAAQAQPASSPPTDGVRAAVVVSDPDTPPVPPKPRPMTPAAHAPDGRIPSTSQRSAEAEPKSPAVCAPPSAPVYVAAACAAPCPKADWFCADPGRFWVRAEYLHWWTRDTRFPALVTTTSPGASLLPGALGEPGTVVLLGGSDLSLNERSGGRFTGGFWLNSCQTCGVEASYFFLGSRSAAFDAASTGTFGSAVIARPFFDVLGGAQNAQLAAFPGIASGDIHVRYNSRFQGAEINSVCNLCFCPCKPDCCDKPDCGCESGAKVDLRCKGGSAWIYRLELLGGFRYLDLDEGFEVTENANVNAALPTAAPFFGGSSINTDDRFDTRNSFYGGQIGARGELRKGRLSIEATGKVALGATHEIVEIRGSTVVTPAGGTPVTTAAGFLASGSNSGRFSRDEFAVVPEAQVNLGWYVTEHARLFVGYNFLYWSAVVRPADQIDNGLSGTQIPTDTRFNPQAGPARPGPLLRDTGFWAQGINAGMEFRF